jgi:hypothetical protein
MRVSILVCVMGRNHQPEEWISKLHCFYQSMQKSHRCEAQMKVGDSAASPAALRVMATP